MLAFSIKNSDFLCVGLAWEVFASGPQLSFHISGDLAGVVPACTACEYVYTSSTQVVDTCCSVLCFFTYSWNLFCIKPMELLHDFPSLWCECDTAYINCLLLMDISLFPVWQKTSLCLLLHGYKYLLVMFLELLGQGLCAFWFWFCQIAFGRNCAGSHPPMMCKCFWYTFKDHFCLLYVLHVLRWPWLGALV